MHKTFISAAAAAALASVLSAQQQPDFSGAWLASQDEPAGVPRAASALLGTQLWLQQAGDRLTVIRPLRDTAIAAAFPLDGSEVRTRIPGGTCMGDSASVEKAAWDGSAIAFTLIASVPPGGGIPAQMNVTRVMRLESPDTLVVEATLPQAGKGGPRRVATVYRRASEPMPKATPLDTTAATQATLKQIAWLSGVWTGTSRSTTVEERWTPAGGGSMLATARTLRGGGMTSFEFLCIAERDGGLVYTALPNARTPPVDFRLTTITPDSITFENPKHDYPKLVRYARLPDGSLETTVGGDPKQEPEKFVLKRTER